MEYIKLIKLTKCVCFVVLRKVGDVVKILFCSKNSSIAELEHSVTKHIFFLYIVNSYYFLYTYFGMCSQDRQNINSSITNTTREDDIHLTSDSATTNIGLATNVTTANSNTQQQNRMVLSYLYSRGNL